ncbi:uncharacterized protein LOC131076325 [Cryptomeria japonica]|uniref:uncharacterized protein LOC131076325 n=1 Tax=Cryptomeria japonica TaxID=3369 RepID=UPI0025AD9AC9|nr:uncharacterized protein LOC131076325 [Cryptomeria japonica]XP_057869441.1 uncharacterized protein LOC131076325 [Cryptomeria japonica]
MAESLISLTNSLERATQLTKYLPSAANQQEISAIYASLRDTQQSIQNFLQQQERQLALSENSNISAYSRGGEEQAMVEDEEGDQQMPATVEDEEVERLQETMKEVCALQNKRRKRARSPDAPVALYCFDRSWAREQGFKPQDRQRKFDLIFQFHA